MTKSTSPIRIDITELRGGRVSPTRTLTITGLPPRWDKRWLELLVRAN